jgi:hypothetical protein
MHELSHYFVALLTGGQPSSFSVWPKRVGNVWILGSVKATPTILSAAPTALAPLAWLAIGYSILVTWNLQLLHLSGYIIVVILYACSAACIPSWQDIKVALKHPLSLLLWMGGAYISCFHILR